jgi:hypothetical protein
MLTPAKKRFYTLPHKNQKVCLVDRESLRVKGPCRTFRVPYHLKGVMATIPTPPAAFSWSNNGQIKFPILGNDREGDCFYADVLHIVQMHLGMNGREIIFNVNDVLSRYEQLSGGDNGLNDQDIFPEWLSGVVGPRGPHKILDWMTVDPSDDAATLLAMWAFCGVSYTCSLLDTWLANTSPGTIWDAGGRPDPTAGHAVALTGSNGKKQYELQTWAIDPCIRLTPAGLKSADPELQVVFSVEMFDAYGKAPCGLSYDALATLWVQLGGKTLPPSPFVPPPPPPPPPGPVTGGDIILTNDMSAGAYTILPAGQVGQLQAALVALVAILPNTSMIPVSDDLQRRLDAKAINLAKLLQLVFAVLAFIESGAPTPASIAALIAQIQAILAS